MKERPILFSGPMVRAILDGRKTQTRRIVKPQPTDARIGGASSYDEHGEWVWWSGHDGDIVARAGRCPYGQPGDRLWVRENVRRSIKDPDLMAYELDDVLVLDGERNWPSAGERKVIPSIHLPRWASRLTLEIVSVKVERLQDIDDYDAIEEGVSGWVQDPRCETPRDGFRVLWESIYGAGSWAQNPWVWVIEFRRVER